MFGINEIHKQAKFRYLKQGYSYKVRAIDWDGRLCNVFFEVINFSTKITNVLVVKELARDIISDILSLDYFLKMKVEKYSQEVCLNVVEDNIYEMNFVTEEKKLHPIILLTKYCNGHEVKILSGGLEGKVGIYKARLNDMADRGFVELAEIDGQTYDLKEFKFQFIENRKQLSWEGVLGA